MKPAALLLGGLLLAAVAGCDPFAPATPTAPSDAETTSPVAQPGEPVEASAREAGFELRATADRAVYREGEPVRVEAALAPVGRGRRVDISGSSTPVTFALEQVDGDRRMDPVSTADCVSRELGGQAPLVVPFSKSGSPSSDPANEPFWNEFFADPQFRLPAGAWRIEAIASFSVGPECTARPISIVVPLDIVVEP